MGAWGIKALERDEGLDVLDILKNEYVPEHPVMDLGEMIELMKEEVMLGSDFSQIDFLFDNTTMALAELYFQWKDNGKLDYDHEEAIWDKVTGFTASKEALAFLLRQLTDIKNEVPDEDGIREIMDLWKNEDSGEIAPAWLEHLNQLIDRLDSEQEARQMYMAEVIEERFANWQGQDFDEDTLEPSEVAQAIMEYLDCECTYFPSMADDDPIMSAYSYAQRLGVREGFVPVLIQADDETLLECLVMNADPKNDVDIYEFDLKAVTEYRKKMLSTPVKDGKTVLEELTGQRKEEAEDDDMDWDEEVLGEMEGGEPNDRFSSYWDDDTEMTYPLILAKIPVKNPWEIFAYLPFGNWNDCPDTPELMAAAKYWFQQHGAIPAAMSHDELEFELPTPISKERAMEVAVEQYGFCPDLDQNEDGSIGSLADVLWQSTVWYFWWD